MEFVRSEVGLPRRIRADLVAQPLEFATTYIGEILACGRRGRALVQEYGNSQFGRGAGAQLARQCDTVLHGCAVERNKRHDIGGTDARMLTLMRGQIDAFLRDLHGGKGGGDGRLE